MQIQIHTDHNIEGHEKFAAYVKSVVEANLSRFSDRITRVEVHFSDENGPKEGKADKRCMMEARLEGRPPIAVTHHAESLDQSIDGAIDKLERAVESTVDKLHEHR